MKNNRLRVYNGAVAVVTGGASGIGRALAGELARRGAEVVLADLQDEAVGAAAAEIRSMGAKATATVLDVADSEAVQNLVRETMARTGRLDFLFSNAGIGIGGEVRDYTLEDWNRLIDVNLRGVVHGVQAAYGPMADQGFGHLVNTASMAGLCPTPFSAGYGMTKHAVVGLSNALRIEGVGLGVRVSVICPGVIRTPILDGGRYGRVIGDISREQTLATWERLRPMDPAVFASKVLDQVAVNRAIIIVPGWWRIFWWIYRLSPALVMRLARKSYGNMKRELGM
ncbi:MAG: SDR family oxidoreductase [Desulfobacterales bacterium]|nr:SDR family oxidoreductase [Desulfobacterales bacterium]